MAPLTQPNRYPKPTANFVMTRSGLRLYLIRCLPLLLVWLSFAAILANAQEQPTPPTSSSDPAPTAALTIVVEGVEGPLRDNVLAHLDINRFAGKTPPAETELRWLHANAERHIQEALQPFGYYEPVIESSLNPTGGGGWEARYRIQPGRSLPMALVDVQLTGDAAHDPVFQALVDKQPLVKGQPLDHAKYEQFKQNLEALATERGYFDARFSEHAIQIDLYAYEAAIKLHYDTGRRYLFLSLIHI